MPLMGWNGLEKVSMDAAFQSFLICSYPSCGTQLEAYSPLGR